MSSYAMSAFAKSGHPVYAKPFTIVDPQRKPWCIATDRISFVATQGEQPYPRLRSDIGVLTTVLQLLRQEPTSSVSFTKAEVLGRLKPEGLATVLGVPIELKRLHQILARFPEKHGEAWDASALGAPVLGIRCDGVRAYVAGFERAEDLPEFSLLSPEEARFASLMNED